MIDWFEKVSTSNFRAIYSQTRLYYVGPLYGRTMWSNNRIFVYKAFAMFLLESRISFVILDESTGTYMTSFGTLFNDTRCAGIFEALVGTLRAAKRKGIVSYEGELLLEGVHDNVDIVLIKPDEWISGDIK